MKINAVGKLVLVAAFCYLITACTPTYQCGTWVFSGTPTGTQFPLSSAFTFNPSGCGQNCPGSQDVMIQMVWIYDADTHSMIYPSSEPGRQRRPRWMVYRSRNRRRLWLLRAAEQRHFLALLEYAWWSRNPKHPQRRAWRLAGEHFLLRSRCGCLLRLQHL